MLPEHSPFSPDQRPQISSFLVSLSPLQRAWLAGFLSAESAAPSSAPTPVAARKLTILYGTESGNSEKLADLSAKEARKQGFTPAVKSMSDVEPESLAKIENLLVIVSTWGDGDPPETAAAFYKSLMSGTWDLGSVNFSVCALGDTSYERFCQTGKDIDARLEALGAKRVSDRQDCDVDYQTPYKNWLESALKALDAASPLPAAAAGAPSAGDFAFSFPAGGAGSAYDKETPFSAPLLERVLLNDTRGSAKETWHYEISLENSGLRYEPGDSLGVYPVNADDIVSGLLQAAKLTGNESVEVNGSGSKPLADALRTDFDLTALSRPVLTRLQELTKSKNLATLLSDESKDEFKDYLWGRWIADAVADFAKKGLGAAELVSILRKLPPRLYSIASSPLAHPDEVHLTVASVRYHAHGVNRKGVASTYLADLVKKDDPVRVYTNENRNFRLPASPDTPIIMVGPGTGVAPFRAFVEHRAAQEQTGRSWLFFGDQHYSFDFLYQLEWQDHLKSGALTRLDAAFSRDQPEKVYVQHRLAAQGAEIYSWLQDGGHFYVCGDASRMARDVNDALLAIVEKHGGLSREAAELYLEDLKKSKRYQRDVY